VATPPQYWLNCDGSQISRTTYAALYTLIGTTFGPGDGSTTFNLPDLRGRVGLGAGQGSGLTNRLLAAIGGEENHILSIAELASHTHTVTDPGHAHQAGGVGATAGGGGFSFGNTAQQWSTYSNTTGITGVNATGSGTGHNTMPPFLAINFIIKVTLEVPLNNPVAPIADTTTSGLVNKLSGNATDYIGGDNACHALSLSFPVRTYTANGLAPGINQRIQLHDDFSWYASVTATGYFGITYPFNWYFSGTGTGASIASQYVGYGTQDSFNKCYGVLAILTGAAVTNIAYMITATQLVYAGLGALDLYYRVAFARLPTAADNFNFQFGLVDAPSTFANSIAIYPTYDTGLGAPCWQGYTSKAGTFTYTAKSTTPAIVAFAATSLTYYNCHISINAAWTVVSFYVNGTQIGTGITTNIPTAVQLYHMLYTQKTVGSSAQAVALLDDYFFDYQYALP
jgi:microcystin-dependent protein